MWQGVVHSIDVLIWVSFFFLSGCFNTFGTSFYVALADYATVAAASTFRRGGNCSGRCLPAPVC